MAVRRRTRWILAAWLLAVLAGGCGGSVRTSPAAGSATPPPSRALSVAAAVSRRPAGSVEILAYVDAPPEGDTGGTTSPGCPVALDRLPALTDRPFLRSFTVAGISLPDPVPASLPSLRLVTPLDLGLIAVPPHAVLRGHFGDPAYAQCADPGSLFVLDAIDQALPSPAAAAAAAPVSTSGWKGWHDAGVGIGLKYPAGWTVTVVRNVGAILRATFQGTPASQAIQLAVIAGQTIATPGAEANLPTLLAGAQQLPAQLGPLQARLVDAPGSATSAGENREVRLVTNYLGNTVVLSVRFTDGLALDRALLSTVTAMAASVRFDHPVEASDPLDPTLGASATLGPGPFISRAQAAAAAVTASGLRQATVVDAHLVAERAARLADAGTCRAFQGRPQGVWLVTVQGTPLTGSATRMLVYLDATTAALLCQAPMSSAAP